MCGQFALDIYVNGLENTDDLPEEEKQKIATVSVEPCAPWHGEDDASSVNHIIS